MSILYKLKIKKVLDSYKHKLGVLINEACAVNFCKCYLAQKSLFKVMVRTLINR